MINGRPHELAGATTVADVVAGLTSATAGVAVAVNGEVVPRRGWSTALLTDGDRIDVLTAVQGG
ncbi:MAG: sulfur carrier protein ThiS [Actinobacteria bacterium]|nr:sulfur carrier protein ThiS [Actinomycetota bacterium]